MTYRLCGITFLCFAVFFACNKNSKESETSDKLKGPRQTNKLAVNKSFALEGSPDPTTTSVTSSSATSVTSTGAASAATTGTTTSATAATSGTTTSIVHDPECEHICACDYDCADPLPCNGGVFFPKVPVLTSATTACSPGSCDQQDVQTSSAACQIYCNTLSNVPAMGWLCPDLTSPACRNYLVGHQGSAHTITLTSCTVGPH